MRKEIAMALKMNKNVVPITTEDFVWPAPESLPEDIRAITVQNAIAWVHAYQNAVITRLLSFLVK